MSFTKKVMDGTKHYKIKLLNKEIKKMNYVKDAYNDTLYVVVDIDGKGLDEYLCYIPNHIFHLDTYIKKDNYTLEDFNSDLIKYKFSKAIGTYSYRDNRNGLLNKSPNTCYVSTSDKIRYATEEDFDNFMVISPSKKGCDIKADIKIKF
jgi:hypothetical protein